MNTERLGFIGLGNMGHPIAKNLEKAGFALGVYNRTSSKAADFAEQSVIFPTVEELVLNSTIIFTMLTDDQAVKEVYEQILKMDVSGKLFVDMSTISPEVSVAVANALKIKQASMIDAPVAGSTKPAAEGTLIIMVGGDEKDVLKATPYLEKTGKLIKYLGENGKGLSAKIAVNYFLAMIYEGLAETILFADDLNITRQDMLEIINESASGSGATKVKTPLLLENNFSPAFSLNLMLKDLKLAKNAGAHFPSGKSVLDTYQKASSAGMGEEDVIGIINYLKQKQS